MASQEYASTSLATPVPFGAWLRQAREQKSLPQRSIAAAADMDSSHYGKVESGRRFLTEEQATAIAPLLGRDKTDVLTRLIAARLLAECDGNHALAHSVGGFVQEQAAPYLVNKSADNRIRKK